MGPEFSRSACWSAPSFSLLGAVPPVAGGPTVVRGTARNWGSELYTTDAPKCASDPQDGVRPFGSESRSAVNGPDEKGERRSESDRYEDVVAGTPTVFAIRIHAHVRNVS